VRLLRREEYRAALAAGPAGVRRYFTLFARPNGLGQARIGIIVGSRVARRAVDRNRAKRLVREAFRRARYRLGSLDVVVELRRRVLRNSVTAAGAEINWLLDELSTGKRAGEGPSPA
jgi:ribonuclease P protein component